MLERRGGLQWPLPHSPAGALPGGGARRGRGLFEDGRFFTQDGRARFNFEEPRPVPEPVDADFPFVLLTGRGSSAQWHTQSRTAKSAILRKMHPAALLIDIHPLDAVTLKIKNG